MTIFGDNKLKGMCYIVLALGFLMSYQSNPVFIIGILGVGGLIYVYFKRKKSANAYGKTGLLRSGRASADEGMNSLISLMMVQQLLSKDSQVTSEPTQEISEEEQKIENNKREILRLLEGV